MTTASGGDELATTGADNVALAGPLVAGLITKELENSRATATSVQTRGLAVITTSGTLVTLLFGLSALATKAQNFTLTDGIKIPLYLAASLLVLAAGAGLLTNAPRGKDAIKLHSLQEHLAEEHWNAPAVHAEREIARIQLTIAETGRKLNNKAARFLQLAIAFELAGIGCVTWAVIALIAT